jgi:hypothetical protein
VDLAASQGGKMMSIMNNVRKGKRWVMMTTKETEGKAIGD